MISMIESGCSKRMEELQPGCPGHAGVHKIGVVSDTHGLVRPEAVRTLEGSEIIIHAGDIGGPKVLLDLEAVAEVVAVRGNNDLGEWARSLPRVKVIDVDGARVAVVHILRDLSMNIAHVDCIISGHSHIASIRRKNDMLYLNPGTAGARRFGKHPTVAVLRVHDAALDAEIIRLRI
jgi:putative phosphoesterase